MSDRYDRDGYASDYYADDDSGDGQYGSYGRSSRARDDYSSRGRSASYERDAYSSSSYANAPAASRRAGYSDYSSYSDDTLTSYGRGRSSRQSASAGAGAYRSSDGVSYRSAGTYRSPDAYRGTGEGSYRASGASGASDTYRSSDAGTYRSSSRSSARTYDSGQETARQRVQARTSRTSQQGGRAAYAGQATRSTRGTHSERTTRTDQTSRTTRASSRAEQTSRTSARAEQPTRTSRASHAASAQDYSYAEPKKKRNILKIALIAVAAVVVVAGIGIAIYLNTISSNMHAGVTQDLRNALVETDMSKEPFYMLLIGSDGSQQRDEEEGYGGISRSDSMMLARVDAPNKKVTLVSLHRDTMTDMGEYGVNKLNAAHAFGGAALTVETVAKLCDVDISHYAEINFDAFVAVVDAIGGVEVDVPISFEDEDAGGSLEAGVQVLDGEQALILCRARHAFDEMVGDADLIRAANQRMVLGAIAHKLLESDVATIANTVRVVSEYVTTDLEINDLIGLAQALQGFDPGYDLYSGMQPVEAMYEDDIWWAVTSEPDWTNMMARVKQGLPPVTESEIDEATGTVMATAGTGAIDTSVHGMRISVRNGTDRSGLGAEAAGVLQKAGYTNINFGNANSTDWKETVVVCKSEAQEADGWQIVKDLGQGKVIENDGDFLIEGSFLVIVGADWKSPSS